MSCGVATNLAWLWYTWNMHSTTEELLIYMSNNLNLKTSHVASGLKPSEGRHPCYTHHTLQGSANTEDTIENSSPWRPRLPAQKGSLVPPPVQVYQV